MVRFPVVALLAAALTVLTAGAADGPSLVKPSWREIAPGLEFARVEARRYCRGGSPGVAAVRIDPARCQIAPYSETEFPGAGPVGIEAWQRRLDAPVVFNAGLFDEGRRHLGILRRAGLDLGGRPHAKWNGVLAARADHDSLAPAALLDLAVPEQRDHADRYETAVQSMMLFDRTTAKRVRSSERAAPRTLVAEAASGHLVVLVTEGDYTLWEAADLLLESGWGLTAAMALDGGREANLLVESPAVRYRSSEGDVTLYRTMERMIAMPPAVIAVWPDSAAVAR